MIVVLLDLERGWAVLVEVSCCQTFLSVARLKMSCWLLQLQFRQLIDPSTKVRFALTLLKVKFAVRRALLLL